MNWINGNYGDDAIDEDLASVCRFFDKIIKRGKTPTSRDTARKMKATAIEGLGMCYSCYYAPAVDEERKTLSEMESELWSMDNQS